MTDMGWMMGPWLVFGALLLGGTLFLIYDGAPGLSRPRSAVGLGRAPSHHHPGRLAHPDPRADAARRSAGAPARPVLAALASPPPASRGTPTRGCGCSRTVGGGQAPDHQLFRRDRDLRRDRDGQSAAAAQAVRLFSALPRHRGGRRRRGRAAGARAGRRTGDPGALDRDDPRLLEGPRSATWIHTGRAGRAFGSTAILPRSTPTACGTSWGARTTRSRLPANAWARQRLNRSWSATQTWSRRQSSACPDEIKGSEVVAFCVLAQECEACDELRQELRRLVANDPGQAVGAARNSVRARPAEDPQRQGDAAHDPRRLPGGGSRRCLIAGQPGSGGGDPRRDDRQLSRWKP